MNPDSEAFRKHVHRLAFEAGMRFHAFRSGMECKTWEYTWADISFTMSRLEGYDDKVIKIAEPDIREAWHAGANAWRFRT